MIKNFKKMNFKTSPVYSFSLSKKCEIDKDDRLYSPGPEKYSPKKVIMHYGALKIGLSKRAYTKKEETPGPGTYNIPSKFPKGLKYSLGFKIHYENNKEQMYKPGPGTYKIINKSQSSFYSFGKKIKDRIKDETPGPGKYNLRREKDLYIPSYIFGKEKRISSTLSPSEVGPGPGNYKYCEDAIRLHYPHYSFMKERRKTLQKSNADTPGPGTYNHKEYLGKEGLKISLSPRLLLKNKNLNSIGPGQYNRTDLNFYKPRSPTTKMGKFKRFSLSCYDLFSTPGPGRYNYMNSITVVKKCDPAWKMGKEKRRPLIEIDKYIPAPGIYNITSKLGKDSPYYSIGRKEKEKQIKFNSPGPGKYDVNQILCKVKSPAWKIGKNKKVLELKINEDIPGPGAYTIDRTNKTGPKFGFSKSKRGLFTKNDFPGPGSYHIPCSIENINTYTRIKGNFSEEFRYI